MGHRAQIKQTRREIRKAFEAASDGQKAALLKALETRAGLSPQDTLKILKRRETVRECADRVMRRHADILQALADR